MLRDSADIDRKSELRSIGARIGGLGPGAMLPRIKNALREAYPSDADAELVRALYDDCHDSEWSGVSQMCPKGIHQCNYRSVVHGWGHQKPYPKRRTTAVDITRTTTATMILPTAPLGRPLFGRWAYRPHTVQILCTSAVLRMYVHTKLIHTVLYCRLFIVLLAYIPNLRYCR